MLLMNIRANVNEEYFLLDELSQVWREIDIFYIVHKTAILDAPRSGFFSIPVTP